MGQEHIRARALLFASAYANMVQSSVPLIAHQRGAHRPTGYEDQEVLADGLVERRSNVGLRRVLPTDAFDTGAESRIERNDFHRANRARKQPANHFCPIRQRYAVTNHSDLLQPLASVAATGPGS
jgi:hypothetical protein